jgi:hypothetical protein
VDHGPQSDRDLELYVHPNLKVGVRASCI